MPGIIMEAASLSKEQKQQLAKEFPIIMDMQ